MRYQSARVVLGACLIAATAAAQAPASISNSEATRGSGLVERAPGERIALGSAGGYIAGAGVLIEYLINKAHW